MFGAGNDWPLVLLGDDHNNHHHHEVLDHHQRGHAHGHGRGHHAHSRSHESGHGHRHNHGSDRPGGIFDHDGALHHPVTEELAQHIGSGPHDVYEWVAQNHLLIRSAFGREKNWVWASNTAGKDNKVLDGVRTVLQDRWRDWDTASLTARWTSNELTAHKPDWDYGSNTARWSSNQLMRLSNLIFNELKDGDACCEFSSNMAAYAVNNFKNYTTLEMGKATSNRAEQAWKLASNARNIAAHASNVAEWTSNELTAYTPLELGQATYDMSEWCSNNFLEYTPIKMGTKAYNTAMWSSNTSQWASNTASDCSNKMPPGLVEEAAAPPAADKNPRDKWGKFIHVTEPTNKDFNKVYYVDMNGKSILVEDYNVAALSQDLSNIANYASNTAFYASNTATWSSNTVFYTSNVAIYGSNTAFFASNTSVYASNTAHAASNASYWASNRLSNYEKYQGDTRWASNAAWWASNALSNFPHCIYIDIGSEYVDVGQLVTDPARRGNFLVNETGDVYYVDMNGNVKMVENASGLLEAQKDIAALAKDMTTYTPLAKYIATSNAVTWTSNTARWGCNTAAWASNQIESMSNSINNLKECCTNNSSKFQEYYTLVDGQALEAKTKWTSNQLSNTIQGKVIPYGDPTAGTVNTTHRGNFLLDNTDPGMSNIWYVDPVSGKPYLIYDYVTLSNADANAKAALAKTDISGDNLIQEGTYNDVVNKKYPGDFIKVTNCNNDVYYVDTKGQSLLVEKGGTNGSIMSTTWADLTKPANIGKYGGNFVKVTGTPNKDQIWYMAEDGSKVLVEDPVNLANLSNVASFLSNTYYKDCWYENEKTARGHASYTIGCDVGVHIDEPLVDLHVAGKAAEERGVLAVSTQDGQEFLTLMSGEFGRGSTVDAAIGFHDKTNLRIGKATSIATEQQGADGNGWTELMCIQNDGKVGMGTDNPKSTAHIADANRAILSLSLKDNTQCCQLMAGGVASTPNSISGGTTADQGIAFSTDFRFGTVTTVVSNDWKEKMCILNNGNVGIGVDAPIKALQVNGEICSDVGVIRWTRSSYGVYFRLEGDPGSKFLLMSTPYGDKWGVNGVPWNVQRPFIYDPVNGNVYVVSSYASTVAEGANGKLGVGTDSPQRLVHVQSATRAVVGLSSSSGSKCMTLMSGGPKTGEDAAIGFDDSTNLRIGTQTSITVDEGATGWSEKMCVLNNGNVGINEANPDYLLDVEGWSRVARSSFDKRAHINLTFGNNNRFTTATQYIVGEDEDTMSAYIEFDQRATGKLLIYIDRDAPLSEGGFNAEVEVAWRKGSTPTYSVKIHNSKMTPNMGNWGTQTYSIHMHHDPTTDKVIFRVVRDFTPRGYVPNYWGYINFIMIGMFSEPNVYKSTTVPKSPYIMPLTVLDNKNNNDHYTVNDGEIRSVWTEPVRDTAVYSYRMARNDYGVVWRMTKEGDGSSDYVKGMVYALIPTAENGALSSSYTNFRPFKFSIDTGRVEIANNLIQLTDPGPNNAGGALGRMGIGTNAPSMASGLRLSIDGNTYIDGKLGVGVNNPSVTLQVNGAGLATSGFSQGSDERIKEDITHADIDTCYTTVKKLPLRYFKIRDFVSDDAVTDRHQLGWIAQDVEKVFPKAVNRIPLFGIDDCYILNDNQLYASLYGAVQKLMHVTETQTEQLATKDAEIADLKAALAAQAASLAAVVARLDAAQI